MKLATANKINRLWNNGVLAKMVAKTKVLKTLEEVAASTNEENVMGAPAGKELINKLNGCSLEQVGEDFYIVGADSVRKKLGKLNFVLSTSVTIYYQDLNNVRTQVNAKITYTYKDGVLSHSVTNTSSGDTCTVSKTIAVS